MDPAQHCNGVIGPSGKWQKLQVNTLNSNTLPSLKSFLKSLFFLICHQNICPARCFTPGVSYWHSSSVFYSHTQTHSPSLPTIWGNNSLFLALYRYSPSCSGTPVCSRDSVTHSHEESHWRQLGQTHQPLHSQPCSADTTEWSKRERPRTSFHSGENQQQPGSQPNCIFSTCTL